MTCGQVARPDGRRVGPSERGASTAGGLSVLFSAAALTIGCARVTTSSAYALLHSAHTHTHTYTHTSTYFHIHQTAVIQCTHSTVDLACTPFTGESPLGVFLLYIFFFLFAFLHHLVSYVLIFFSSVYSKRF